MADLASQRKALPIFTARKALLREILVNACCVVVGETGSGKTTQIPQSVNLYEYILEAGFTKKGGVAVTQPRRVAAVSVARRVALERGGRLGGEVGYSVRFDDCSSATTTLKYMTDGMLLREAISDPLLKRYSFVILDEAHERTVHTDLLFGVVKAAQKARKKQSLHQLKIIVMSATLSADSFSRYFSCAKVLYIQGRQFPVQLHYTVQPQPDYLHSAVSTVLQLHEEDEVEGDLLVFLTGREEIEAMQAILEQCRALFPSDWKDIVVCPLYAALPGKQQQKVFAKTPSGVRKVILSTNVAETSITIPGVSCVLDTGMVKARGYNPRIGLDLLCVQPVSKAQARQRSGRAGRQAPGHCYRLYTEEAFEALAEDTIPEIQRCPLSSVVLQLLALGETDILAFDFMDPPSEDALVTALEELYLLGAVRGGGGTGEEGGVRLTDLGARMAHFPLEPRLAKAIISAQEYGCTEEVVNIVSLLSVDSVLFTPHDRREQAVAAREKFSSDEGDHATLLNVYQAYKSVKGNKAWCRENFIHMRNMRTLLEVRAQLGELCGRMGVQLSSAPNASQLIRKALLCGLFTNTAQHMGEGRYITLGSTQEVYIHPSSCLFHKRPQPQCLMYSELIHTTKCYMRDVSVVESDWLMEVAPDHFRMART